MCFSIGGNSIAVDVHKLDLSRAYIAERAWMVGSCPHVVAELSSGNLVYLGEVLSDAWLVKGTSSFSMPSDSVRLHICEFEFEQTDIESVSIGGVSVLQSPRALRQGDKLTFSVQGRDQIQITGSYRSKIQSPDNVLQRRQKASLIKAGLHDLLASKNRDRREPHLL